MSSQPVKVLLVEDETVYAELLTEILGASGRFEVTAVGRFDEAGRQLGAAPFDVVLLDLSRPDRTGLATCRELRGAHPSMPIVVLTGSDRKSTRLNSSHIPL